MSSGTFDLAVQWINSNKKALERLPQEQQEKLYGLFKVATVGPNNTPQPYFWQVVETAKWQAWTKYSTLSSDKAKEEYVKRVELIKEWKRKTDQLAQ